jgi:hypothetical protein
MSEKTVVAERRQNTRLRSIFEEAYDRVAPFLDPRQAWGGVPLERLAFRMLRDSYPELSPEEARVLVVASVRVYSTRNPDKAGHLPGPDEIALPAQ